MHSSRRIRERAWLPKGAWKHKEGLCGKVPPEFLRTAEWKPQLSGRTSRKKLKVSYRDNREAQEICGFFTENRRKTLRLEEGTLGIEKRLCYISDWTRLLTSQTVNSCKRKDHQGGKKDRIIPGKVNRHMYTKLFSSSFPCNFRHGIALCDVFDMLCKIDSTFEV